MLIRRFIFDQERLNIYTYFRKMSAKRRASDEIQRKENKVNRKSDQILRPGLNFPQHQGGQQRQYPQQRQQFQKQPVGQVVQNQQQPGPHHGPPRGPQIRYNGQQIRLGQQVTGELILPKNLSQIPNCISVSPLRGLRKMPSRFKTSAAPTPKPATQNM